MKQLYLIIASGARANIAARNATSPNLSCFLELAITMTGSPGWAGGPEQAYCRNIAILKRSSGEIRWSWSSLVVVCAICAMLLLITFIRLSFMKIPYFYALFFGMGYAGLAALLPLMTADFFAGPAYGSIFGTLYLLHGLGGAFGAWFAGFLYDHVQSYVPLFIAVIACALLACVTLWMAAPRRVRPGSHSGSGMFS